MATVKFLSSGMYTTLQDKGRNHYAQYGIPVSGYMDSFSANKANLLVNNDINEALFEITLQGPKILFDDDLSFAVTGAAFEMFLNDNLITNDKVHHAKGGDTLSFKRLKKGCRAYLAFAGTPDFKIVLGSKSLYSALYSQTKIEKGDIFTINKSSRYKRDYARVNFSESGIFKDKIEVYPGPEYDLLNNAQQHFLKNTDFTLSPGSNRMALVLNEALENTLKGILTGPVVPGTVQLTPDGTLIILAKDAQVTGGYPRILQVSESGMNCLAQKKPNEIFQLEFCDSHLI